MLRLVILSVFGTVCGNAGVYRHTDSFLDSMLQFEKSKHLPGQTTFKNDTRVCFDEGIGCFDWEETKFSGNFPEDPGQKGINTTFYLYSRTNPASGIPMMYENAKTFSNIVSLKDSTKPLFIVAHGLEGSHRTFWVVNMTRALLNVMDCNVIAIDWRRGSSLPLYNQAVANTMVVGRAAAKILSDISKIYNYSPKMMHYIGFSMGAQVGGFAGRHFYKLTSTKFGRMTILDAAAPGFEAYGMNVNLTDSEFTIAVHTSAGSNIIAGKVGMVHPIGHIDFYPNGGISQPGCGLFDVKCEHERAHHYFREAVLNSANPNGCQFEAIHCMETREDIQKYNKCTRKGNEIGVMSLMNPKGSGIMYFETNKTEPFCLGSKYGKISRKM